MSINPDTLPIEYLTLRDYLKERFNAKIASGGKECIIRCKFCGDSKNNPRDAHMYVGINRKKNNVISYNCFKCNTNGDVGHAFFRTYDIYDADIVQPVIRYNTEHGSDVFGSANIGRQIQRNLFNPTQINSKIPIKDTEEYRRKLSYINRRIGGMLTLRDLDSYKIILNLKDYLDLNSISNYSRDPRIIDQLSFGFIGFLSADSTHITMRRIVPEEKVHESLRERYTNYSITEAGYQIYCIREGFDPSKPNMICIAEGAFDALSIHYNMLYYMPNKVIFASCGKGVSSVLRYLIYKKGVSFFNTTVHVFIDNDIKPMDLQRYRKDLNDIRIPYMIHRNIFEGEKDFGVPGDHIIDSIMK